LNTICITQLRLCEKTLNTGREIPLNVVERMLDSQKKGRRSTILLSDLWGALEPSGVFVLFCVSNTGALSSGPHVLQAGILPLEPPAPQWSLIVMVLRRRPPPNIGVCVCMGESLHACVCVCVCVCAHASLTVLAQAQTEWMGMELP
jgi:hypothetical protein